MTNTEKQECEHKWVFLRSEGTNEIGYRKWVNVDLFFCEKCLTTKRKETPVLEKPTRGAW